MWGPAVVAAAFMGTLALGLGVARAQEPGFASPPVFGSSGQAAAVFLGGSVDDLEAAARAAGADGVWAQDATGRFELLVVGGPAFLRDAFAARFPGAFTAAVAVTLTRPPGAASTPPPGAATPARPSTFPGGVPGPSANQ